MKHPRPHAVPEARHPWRDAASALLLSAGLALALLTPKASAVAVTGAGAPPPEQARRSSVPALPVAGAVAPTLELAAARIEAVDVASRRITLRGQPVALDANLRIVQGGSPVGGDVRALRAGQQVRLALQPGPLAAGKERAVVLIYIDHQP